MGKISTNDFSGGIQESLAPDDFTPRQSAVMKGIVPRNENTFESQWPIQSIGTRTDINAVFPLESQFGTYLVAITTTGAIYWAKAPNDDDSSTIANAVSWAPINTAENKGYAPGNGTQPSISIESNADYRFITGLPFEVYKYVKNPDSVKASNFAYDDIPEVGNTIPKSIVSGVLIHCRRFYKGSGTKTLQFKNSADGSGYTTQVAVVCYVSPTATDGVVVKAATFPNLRRWPMYYPSGKPTSTTVPSDKSLVLPFIASAKHVQGTTTGVAFSSQYPFASPESGYPRFMNAFHPYTYLDSSSTLTPGYGFIPRANKGTMWGGTLILGDIEYKNDDVPTAKSDKTLTPVANSALIGTSYNNNILRDGSTAPHRGSFYYSEGEIDVFDPRNAIRVSGTDTRIAGMHVVDNRLISITTAGGENDGVIVYTGNVSGIKSYATGTANPFAIRKQVLKGGVGVTDYPDEGTGHITQTCLWADAGAVIFIDKRGGVFATNGQSVNRMDMYGPKQPATSSYYDHPAAVGKYVFVWRNKRMMLFTSLTLDNGQLSGCWTELIPPITATSESDIKSMIGSGNNMYMVANGKVWRYAINGLASERGKINNSTTLDITISTASYGAPQEFTKVNWDKFGIGFSTETGCAVKSITINGGPALQSGVTTYSALSSTKNYSNGYNSLEVPAGIGTRPIVSATYVMQGQFVLEANTFWFNGSTANKEKSNV